MKSERLFFLLFLFFFFQLEFLDAPREHGQINIASEKKEFTWNRNLAFDSACEKRRLWFFSKLSLAVYILSQFGYLDLDSNGQWSLAGNFFQLKVPNLTDFIDSVSNATNENSEFCVKKETSMRISYSRTKGHLQPFTNRAFEKESLMIGIYRKWSVYFACSLMRNPSRVAGFQFSRVFLLLEYILSFRPSVNRKKP